MNDLLLKNAVIYDGSGGPWYRGDVAIREGIINEIGTLTPGCASETIDLEGRVLCPGFVDVHSHSDFSAFLVNDVDGKITQGVTTEVVSNCGLAMTPSVPERAGLLQEYMRPYLPEGVSLHNECSSLEEMMDRIDSSGYVTDLAFHVAHGPLRIAALGFDNRKASPAELELMKGLLAREMESGAVGLSSGLIYPPGCFADTDELVELCRVAAAYGGIYATHMRSESGDTLNAVAEAIDIGRRSGCAVHISHHKIMEQLEGLSEKTLGMMETAQKEGIDVTCDVYPYTAGSTMIGALLPPWVNEGGAARLVARVADPTCRKRIAEDMKKEIPGWDNFSRASGLANILIFTAEKDKTLEG
ncbi:MAG: amidohydrolase family protein, partial [Synergistaceae bacterium]|nr:amidohydrolase family protein [Synergistaceae bacterium]